MALAAPSISLEARARRYAPWELWHLLSLDAPTIAALWTVFFARAANVRLPWIAPMAMATGVWTLYALDRILDSRRAEAGRAHPRELRERHIFHARHQRSFAAAAAILLPLVLLLCLRYVAASVRRDMLLLSLGVAAYFTAVHIFSGCGIPARARVPKEIIVGILFACATAIPAWARQPAARPALLLGGLLFAALCWINCVAIEKWEAASPCALRHAHATTAWGAARLTRCAAALAIASVLAAALAPNAARPIAAACALSAAAIFILEKSRGRLSPMKLRIAADAALLSPLLVLPWLLLGSAGAI